MVARTRLFERLDSGAQRKLILISAPAGYGKTTLASAWIDTLKQRENWSAAWLSLDKEDGNPVRFLSYVIAALQTISPQLGAGALEALDSPQPPSTNSVTTSLLNEIAALPHEYTLVLDDYHTLESGEVDHILLFLLEHLPPQLHLLVTTREDPALPLARMRARGQLTEMRATELRFTFDEVTDFLSHVMQVEIAPDEIALLETRTEGWIAGLQLAAVSMQGRNDVHEFVRAFAGDNRYIMDYLIEEVLEQQPAYVCDFLLQTSILEGLNGPLCDAVWVPSIESCVADADSSNSLVRSSQSILEELEKANLFVDPLDDHRSWFRYHHLFATVLQAHQQFERPGMTAGLHRRASHWYEQNGQRASAIRHALAANDYNAAATLLELVWPEMDGTFQTSVWLVWASSLPEEFVQQRPLLSAGFAWANLSAGRLEDGEEWLSRTERMLARTTIATDIANGKSDLLFADSDLMRTLPASLATARAYLAQARWDAADTIRNGRHALDLLSPDDHVLRGPPAALISMAYWAQGELESAARALSDAMNEFEMAGHVAFAISGAFPLADMRLAQGRMHDAIQVYERSLQLVADGVRTRGTSYLYVGLSGIEIELNNLVEARRLLSLGEESRDDPPLTNWLHRFHLTEALLRESEDDIDGALTELHAAERAFVPTPVPDVRPIGAQIARLWIKLGRLQAVREWADTNELRPDDTLSYSHEFEYMVLARLLLEEHRQLQDEVRLQDAQQLLTRLYADAESGGRSGSVIEILLVQALAHVADRKRESALESVAHALRLAEPQGYVRVFLNEGMAIRELISLANQNGIAPEYTCHLLAKFQVGVQETLASSGDSGASATKRTQPLVEPLSPRELEILELVAQGLSNRQISERLYISVSTVKGHNRNIFSKLQVKRRTGAVARARELNIL